MGSGRWSATTYHDRAAARAAAGTDTFAYSADAIRSGDLRAHQTLDPRGLTIRESRDSTEHPASNAVVIGLDVTGSMGAVVRGIHADLPRLHELLLGHRSVTDPQVMFAAVGDATCDRVPLQVGQFESDNRMDRDLEHMILEGGGGGQKTESYELLLYVAARHTAIDCWAKRRRKGYLFLIGDEMTYPKVKRREVRDLIGDAAPLEADLPLERVAAEAKERYHVYFVLPGGASHGGDQQVIGFWSRLLGPEHVLPLQCPEDTSESIARTILANEGATANPDGTDAPATKAGLVSRAVGRFTGALTGKATTGPTARPAGGRRL
jgi:hypothetical protein